MYLTLKATLFIKEVTMISHLEGDGKIEVIIVFNYSSMTNLYISFSILELTLIMKIILKLPLRWEKHF